ALAAAARPSRKVGYNPLKPLSNTGSWPMDSDPQGGPSPSCMADSPLQLAGAESRAGAPTTPGRAVAIANGATGVARTGTSGVAVGSAVAVGSGVGKSVAFII